jgi:glutamine amidotransferase
MSVCIIDYEGGNLGSVQRALYAVGGSVTLADRPEMVGNARRLILPGVGHFADTMGRLVESGWAAALRRYVDEDRRLLLGICVGMQVLAGGGTESHVSGQVVPGLGFVPGVVERLDAHGCTLAVPQQGWNSLCMVGPTTPLLAGIPHGTDVYFSNSYALGARSSDAIAATVEYGVEVAAVVARENLLGIQFHPEKSSRAGLRILRNFLEMPC